MVCALAALVFASASARPASRTLAFAFGFLVALWRVSPASPPDAEWVGVLAATAAVITLGWPRRIWVGALSGGALAGIWVTLFQLQGLPRPAALAVAVGVTALTMWQTRRRPRFAPEVLIEEAVVVVAVAGVTLAILPGILEGWQSATLLNVQVESSAPPTTPLWVFFVVAMSLTSGMAYSLWSHRR